ncbi:MAG: Minf_1886 family protein [Phycisphaerae bacterium]
MPMNETTRKTLEQVVDECGRYPVEAFEFVRHGLNHTVAKIHGDLRAKSEHACHVSGQQLCWGLRNYAVEKYGLLAETVLSHWGIVRTSDFGRIVFAMVDNKLMQKTDDDDIRDFYNVFEFSSAFSPPQRPQTPPKCIFQL